MFVFSSAALNINPMEQIEREREDQEKKLKKMEQEMEQVFEMKVKEKKKKLKDSESEVGVVSLRSPCDCCVEKISRFFLSIWVAKGSGWAVIWKHDCGK